MFFDNILNSKLIDVENISLHIERLYEIFIETCQYS